MSNTLRRLVLDVTKLLRYSNDKKTVCASSITKKKKFINFECKVDSSNSELLNSLYFSISDKIVGKRLERTNTITLNDNILPKRPTALDHSDTLRDRKQQYVRQISKFSELLRLHKLSSTSFHQIATSTCRTTPAFAAQATKRPNAFSKSTPDAKRRVWRSADESRLANRSRLILFGGHLVVVLQHRERNAIGDMKLDI